MMQALSDLFDVVSEEAVDAMTDRLPLYEQIGWRLPNGTFEAQHRTPVAKALDLGWEPVYVRREP